MSSTGRQMGAELAQLLTSPQAPADMKASIKAMWENMGEVMEQYLSGSGGIPMSALLSAWQQTPDHQHIASEKLVKDSLDGKAPTSHTHDDRYYTESEMNTKLNAKQNTLTAGKGIKLASNKVSCTALYTITEDMFDLATDATKGVSPYNTSYGYTNITIHDDLGIEWTEGAVYSFSLDTKVAVSTYRNVRVRIGTSGDWKPMMSTSAIASGTTVFIKGRNCLFIYKSVYQSAGALHALWDDGFNNYKLRDYGRIKAGAGTYAITRYSLLMQKPDGTWEKITSTAADYSTGTSKSVNTSGFLLNQIKYYNTTATVAGGSYTADATVDSQHEGFDFRYSSNCGTPSSWVQGQYIYLVGTIGADNLFHLDSSAWWTNALPSFNDGKIYIQLGVVRTAGSYTVSLLNDRPVLYHDGTGIKLYAPSGGLSKNDLLNFVYPVGSIYMSINNVSPQSFLGGTWTALGGKFLLGADSTYTAGSTGGEATHTLTVNEIPSHTHIIDADDQMQPDGWKDKGSGAHVWNNHWADRTKVTRSEGGGAAHNNMPPYLSVYMWKRTA